MWWDRFGSRACISVCSIRPCSEKMLREQWSLGTRGFGYFLHLIILDVGKKIRSDAKCNWCI